MLHKQLQMLQRMLLLRMQMISKLTALQFLLKLKLA